jgi:hypothetical protein
LFKKAIIFTCVEVVIFFIIYVLHAYLFKIPTISGALYKGILELLYRLIFGQIVFEAILLTLIIYSAFKYKMLLAVLAVALAHIISHSIFVTEISHILDVFRLLPIHGYINTLVMLIIGAILTALLLKEYMYRKLKQLD